MPASWQSLNMFNGDYLVAIKLPLRLVTIGLFNACQLAVIKLV